jgi:hypothetical protein
MNVSDEELKKKKKKIMKRIYGMIVTCLTEGEGEWSVQERWWRNELTLSLNSLSLGFFIRIKMPFSFLPFLLITSTVFTAATANPNLQVFTRKRIAKAKL